MHRWLITGASGQLGAHVAKALRRHVGLTDQIHSFGFSKCEHPSLGSIDLTSPHEVRTLLSRIAPTHILHFAAISSPRAAEQRRAESQALHVDATEIFASYAAQTGNWMMMASSDFVWSGDDDHAYREEDIPTPRSVYGRTKLAGEDRVLAHEAGLVLRYSLLYGLPANHRSTTWTKILDRLVNDRAVDAIVDEWRSPLPLADAAEATVALAMRGERGLLHIAGSEKKSAFELIVGLRDSLESSSSILPVRREARSDGAIRPRDATQSNARLRSILPDFYPGSIADAFMPLKQHA